MLATAPVLRAQNLTIPPWADSFFVVAPGPQYAKGGSLGPSSACTIVICGLRGCVSLCFP